MGGFRTDHSRQPPTPLPLISTTFFSWLRYNSHTNRKLPSTTQHTHVEEGVGAGLARGCEHVWWHQGGERPAGDGRASGELNVTQVPGALLLYVVEGCWRSIALLLVDTHEEQVTWLIAQSSADDMLSDCTEQSCTRMLT